MKEYPTASLRAIALASHQGAGKTSLVEALLFNLGVTTRLGSVDQGTTVSDHDDEEIRRQISLSTSLIAVEAQELKLNFLDTPGYTDFQGEVKNGLYVADLGLLLIDGNAGVEVGTEVYWGFADEFQLPRLVVATKMDRETARSPQVLIDELHSIFGTRVVAIQYPLGGGGAFAGVVDLLSMRAWLKNATSPSEIPSEVQRDAALARTALMEAAAEADDTLLEKYLDMGELSNDDMLRGVRAGIVKRSFIPVAFTSGTSNVGVTALLDLLIRVAPSSIERAVHMPQGQEGTAAMMTGSSNSALGVYIFKTAVDPFVGKLTYFRVMSGILKSDTRYHNHSKDHEERFGPLLVMRGKEQFSVATMHAGDIGAVAKLSSAITGDVIGEKSRPVIIQPPVYPRPVYAVAVRPVSQADSAKMGPTLTRLCDEDATLQWRQDAATKETVIEGMGDVHVDVAVKRAAHLGVHLETAIPRVPYRETITKPHVALYRHKKQTGGAGQFAEVQLRVEPTNRGDGFEFANEVFGGAISNSFIPSIEKGIKSVLETGVIAGYPVVDVRAAVIDGKEHPVDSKDIAFQIAGREAFKLGFHGAGPILLEPIVTLRVTVPESDMGATIGDLSTRRAHVQGTEAASGRAVITATAPLAEVQRYSNELRSFTQGRGVYSLEFSHYQQVPSHVAEQIIASHKKEPEAV